MPQDQQSQSPKQKSRNHGDVILRFSGVSFGYSERHPLIAEADFSIRERAKVTLMGQNGAGKSTIFKLILNELSPTEGAVHARPNATIAIAHQAMRHTDQEKTIREFFAGAFTEKVYALDPLIAKALDAVNLDVPYDEHVSVCSGGEQARLLLAFALIQNPDILLLDEPTNNLDTAGIEHLTKFLSAYQKTVLVISHDAQFLNSFTDGVLYLDVFQKKIEQYVGDYLKVVEEIRARIERERKGNVRLQKEISERKEKMNFFAQKGGHMRDVAKKMREAIEELERQLVEMREEDTTIAPFRIASAPVSGPIVSISSVAAIRNRKLVSSKVAIVLKGGGKLLVRGPNGIGKTTFLEKLISRSAKGFGFGPGVEIGYYAQDFASLNETKTVYETLAASAKSGGEERIRQVAAHFLFPNALVENRVSSLSYGQKGLLAFARFVLQCPHLLVLDEPTNHINFRHLPVIAEALNDYRGALVLVSHMPDFVSRITITETLDLGSFSPAEVPLIAS